MSHQLANSISLSAILIASSLGAWGMDRRLSLMLSFDTFYFLSCPLLAGLSLTTWDTDSFSLSIVCFAHHWFGSMSMRYL